MVRVEPLSGAWAEALTEGEDIFSEKFEIPVVDGWAVFPEALPGALSAVSEDGDRWGAHLFFDDDGALVGWGGWKGPPINGAAELGYAMAPARRGKSPSPMMKRSARYGGGNWIRPGPDEPSLGDYPSP